MGRRSRATRARALGFRGDAFEKQLGTQYLWLSDLGNQNVIDDIEGIRIRNPKAASKLLDLALEHRERRVIFFCHCEFPADCHRRTVSELLIREAQKRGDALAVTEWPGGESQEMQLPGKADLAKALRQQRLRLPVPKGMSASAAASVPWGSTVRVSVEGNDAFAILGPARFGSGGAYLQIFGSGESEQAIAADVKQMRKEGCFEPLLTDPALASAANSTRSSELSSTKTRDADSESASPGDEVAPARRAQSRLHEPVTTDPKAKSTPDEVLLSDHEYTVIAIRAAWAWAIMFGGKDVESRTWPTKVRGRVLIHASSGKDSERDDEWNRSEICKLSGVPRTALPATFERSAILGSIEIVDCVKRARSRWAQPDSYHWLLREPRPLASPVRGVNGRLQFWRWTLDSGRRDSSAGSTARRASIRTASAIPVARHSVALAQSPTTTKAAFDLDSLTPDAVMAALRKVASSTPANDVDVMRAAGRELGCSRLGSRVSAELKSQVRTAIRRGVLVRDCKELRLATSRLTDYQLDALVGSITAVMRKGQVVSRVDVAAAVARRLGFADGGNTAALQGAFDAAIAAGSLHAEDKDRIRRVA